MRLSSCCHSRIVAGIGCTARELTIILTNHIEPLRASGYRGLSIRPHLICSPFFTGNDPELDPDREPEPPTVVADKPLARSGKRATGGDVAPKSGQRGEAAAKPRNDNYTGSERGSCPRDAFDNQAGYAPAIMSLIR